MKKILIKILSKIFNSNEVIVKSFLRNKKKRFVKRVNNNLLNRYSEVEIIFDYFKNETKPSSEKILFDIGAHTGGFFEIFLWDSWKVFAFEPDHAPYKRETLLGFSQISRFSFCDKACSDKDGEILSFFVSEESTGISSLHPFLESHTLQGHVETITLKKYCNENKLRIIDILKIDTEGHDLFVLKGFPWDKIKPTVIFCEFEDRKTIPLGYSYKDLGNYLMEAGYFVYISEWFPVKKYGGNHKWRSLKRFPSELDDSNATGNFLCFSEKLSPKFEKFLLEKIEIVG